MIEIMPLDLWTLFVEYIFGGFWVAVVGLALVMFIIMGVLGRISIFSVMWYLIMFALAMGLGYGYVLVNILITLSLVVALYFAIERYIRT